MRSREDGGRDQRFLHENSDERGATFADRKTQRRGGVGNQKPCTSDQTFSAKERRKRRSTHRRRGTTAKAGSSEQKRKINDKLTTKFRLLSISYACQKRGTKKTGNESSVSSSMMRQKGEAREAHRLSMMLTGRGMGTRRKAPIQEARQRKSLDESVKTREQPINKRGCNGLPIIFSDKVERMRERSDPIVVDQNAIQQGLRDWKCLQASVWKLRDWRATVAWSMPAQLLEIHVFPNGGARKPYKHGLAYKTKRAGSQHKSSGIIKHYFVSLSVVVHAAENAPISSQRAQGAFVPKGATAERFIMVMCPLPRSLVQRLVGQEGQRKNQGGSK